MKIRTITAAFALVASLAFMLMPSGQIAGSATLTSDESEYVGRISTIIAVSTATGDTFVKAAEGFDGSELSKYAVYGACSGHIVVNTVFDTIVAPGRFSAAHDNLDQAFAHMQTAGELCQLGIITGDVAYIEASTAEIKLATGYIEKATDELDKLR